MVVFWDLLVQVVKMLYFVFQGRNGKFEIIYVKVLFFYDKCYLIYFDVVYVWKIYIDIMLNLFLNVCVVFKMLLLDY